MKTIYMQVKITLPDSAEQELTTTGSTLEECVEQIHEYVDSLPLGTRVYMLDCSDEGERYEVEG